MTALREVFKTGKGFDGWSTYLYNRCLGDPKGSPCLLPINTLFQLSRAPIRNNLPRCQHHILTSSRIPYFTSRCRCLSAWMCHPWQHSWHVGL